MEKFEITCTGHEKTARELLLQEKLRTVEELAMMGRYEIEEAINAKFECCKVGDDWLLVPLDKVHSFNAMVKWIER